jgi:hypothetical protein
MSKAELDKNFGKKMHGDKKDSSKHNNDSNTTTHTQHRLTHTHTHAQDEHLVALRSLRHLNLWANPRITGIFAQFSPATSIPFCCFFSNVPDTAYVFPLLSLSSECFAARLFPLQIPHGLQLDL